MWSPLVVVSPPGVNLLPDILERQEPVHVQTLRREQSGPFSAFLMDEDSRSGGVRFVRRERLLQGSVVEKLTARRHGYTIGDKVWRLTP